MFKASIQSTDATMTTTTIAQVFGELHEVKKGCSSPRWNSTRYGPPLNENSSNLRNATQKAGEVACCDYSGTSCVRKDSKGQCFSGDDDADMKTYEEAVTLCSGSGMRLCKSQEELDLCCGIGCNFDSGPVWIGSNTSTTSTTTKKQLPNTDRSTKLPVNSDVTTTPTAQDSTQAPLSTAQATTSMIKASTTASDASTTTIVQDSTQAPPLTITTTAISKAGSSTEQSEAIVIDIHGEAQCVLNASSSG